MKPTYTQYTLITTLPAWVVVWVNEFLVIVAYLTGRSVISTQYPVEGERSGDDDEQV